MIDEINTLKTHCDDKIPLRILWLVKRRRFGVSSAGLNLQFRSCAWLVTHELPQVRFGAFDPACAEYRSCSLVELEGRRARFDRLWLSNFEHLDWREQAVA